MLQITIIIFREVLEIALVISILVAATNGVQGRNRWILAGIGLGIFGASLLAIFTDNISELINGSGQEIFNACVLLASSAMIAWTVIWMKKYGRQISANLKQIGQSVVKGDKSFVTLMVIVALAILREGAEIVLFSYGFIASGGSALELILGAFIGLSCGILTGFALYFGLLKALGRHFFTVTSWMLIFLAAGMISAAIGFLSQAGLVSSIIYPIWDSNFLIDQKGMMGKILHALFGYIAKPSLVQLIGYLTTVLFLVIGLNYDYIKNKLKSVTNY